MGRVAECAGSWARTRSPSLWILLGCLVLYSVNGRTIAELDCDVAPYAAWSLVRHGSFDVSAYAVTRELPSSIVVTARDGSLVSKYPPGSTLAAAPFIAPLAMLWQDPLSTRARMRRLGKHIASIYVAATVVLIYLLCRRVAPSAALPTTLLAALGTTLWSTASQGYWAHGPATFFLALALFILLRSRDGPGLGGLVLVGLSLGMALLSRPTTGLFAAATVLGLVGRRRWKEGIILALVVSAMGGLLVAYNYHHFGNWLEGGYLDEGRAWTTPLRIGMPGLLIAPSRGLLIYSPALFLLPFGFGRLRRGSPLSAHERAMLAAWLAAAAATVFAYASWHNWWGGWSFGPRFLTETIPVLAVVFALAWQNLIRRWGPRGSRVAWGLVLASVVVHFIGVFGYHVDWMASHGEADMFSPWDTQIAARARTLLTRRPQALALPVLAVMGVLFQWRRGSWRPGRAQ